MRGDTMALNDRQIKALRATDKEQRISDGGGLYLRVQVNGRKSFLFRSRVDGVETIKTLGAYPELSLHAARTKAVELFGAARTEGRTLQQAAEAWLGRLKIKTVEDVRWRLEKYVLPKLGSRQLAELHRRDFSAVLIAVAANAPVAANKALGDVKQLYAYAVEVGWVENSPVALLTKKTVGGPEPASDRVLTDAELRAFIRELLTDRFAPKTRLALALMLLSGQRSGEVRYFRPAEFDGTVWTIPKDRTKQKVQPSVVLLPRLGRVLLRLAVTGGPLDMPNQVPGRACARMKFNPPFSPHDLRRTMATKMGDLGIEPYVIEKCLNHKMAGVMAVYNRSEYRPEKTQAWRAWVKFLLKIRKEPA